jgi:Domain of unknown function (DUF4350)
MPAALDSGDRKLLLVAGAILLFLIVVTVILAPSADQDEGPGTPSTYSAAENGTQAAYLLLGELGYRSERWERSPAELPDDANGKILILALPNSFPNKSERAALLNFARSGGWILYVGNFPFLFLETGDVSQPSPAARSSLTAETFSAIAPSPFTMGAAKITLEAPRHWSRTEGAQVPLYGKPEEPVVVTWPLKKGRILWWAGPTPLTNSGISREGNLPFFLGVVQALRPGAGPAETTVLWDEYFHGYRGSLWDYFAETPVPWAGLQLALVAVFVMLAFSRRNGPLYTPAAVSRLSPLEFVDTLGDLYGRANAGSAAVRVVYQRFRAQLLRRLALPPSTSNQSLDAAVRERLGWRQPGFTETLTQAERASRHHECSGLEALKIVQALEHYSVLFGLTTRTNEEKR